MRNFSEDEINEFLSHNDYDVKKSGDARWIDQKCTMDVVSLIADCILEYTKSDTLKEFSASDIWHNKYTVENVEQIFAKPNPEKKAENEYDKYFGQPLKLLGYSRVLNCKVRSRRNYYTINNYELLEFISLRERNAFEFLCCYIEKVLKDSGIFSLFENFFKYQNADAFRGVKEGFSDFTIKYTRINGKLECNRIFIKVLNPLACKRRLRGTVRGYISKDNITLDMIAYNQRNWRDLISSKPKNVTREEYMKQYVMPEDKMTTYKINKAKKNLRNYNNKYRNGKSELYESNNMNDFATQMHHIFPAAIYPEIADFIENLIALTPTEHLNYAHPRNNTNYVDHNYQYFCLIAKAGRIKENLNSKTLPHIYTFSDFTYVLDIGLNTDEFEKIHNMDFGSVLRLIDFNYVA